jgi:DNA-binding GntR family transcriptional regulator
MHYVDKTQIRMGSLTDTVYMRLRGLIDSGELPPGSPLREVHLAERLEVSRTPVREALRRLETEGLATFEARAGLAVAVLDRQRVVEIYGFLETLESAAASAMATHATPDELEQLQALIDGESRALDDPKALSAINARIHQLFYAGARNRYLLKSVLAIRDAIFTLGRTTLGNPGRAAQAHREHVAVLDALRARDPARAAQAMRDHIRSAQRERLKIFDEDHLRR